MVEGRLREGQKEGLMARVKWGLVLGSEAYAERIRARLKVDRESAGRSWVRRRRSFEDVVKMVERVRGEPWAEFRDRKGDWGRDVVLWAARRYGGYKLRELAEKAGDVDYTAISMALKRLDLRAARDRLLAQVVKQVQSECEK